MSPGFPVIAYDIPYNRATTENKANFLEIRRCFFTMLLARSPTSVGDEGKI